VAAALARGEREPGTVGALVALTLALTEGLGVGEADPRALFETRGEALEERDAKDAVTDPEGSAEPLINDDTDSDGEPLGVLLREGLAVTLTVPLRDRDPNPLRVGVGVAEGQRLPKVVALWVKDTLGESVGRADREEVRHTLLVAVGARLREGVGHPVGLRDGEKLRVAEKERVGVAVPQALREGLREDNGDGDADAEPEVEEVTEGERDCVTLSV
jgi:hypothetical protein